MAEGQWMALKPREILRSFAEPPHLKIVVAGDDIDRDDRGLVGFLEADGERVEVVHVVGRSLRLKNVTREVVVFSADFSGWGKDALSDVDDFVDDTRDDRLVRPIEDLVGRVPGRQVGGDRCLKRVVVISRFGASQEKTRSYLRC